MILSNDGLVVFHYKSYGIFFYNKIGSIRSIWDLPTTNTIVTFLFKIIKYFISIQSLHSSDSSSLKNS